MSGNLIISWELKWYRFIHYRNIFRTSKKIILTSKHGNLLDASDRLSRKKIYFYFFRFIITLNSLADTTVRFPRQFMYYCGILLNKFSILFEDRRITKFLAAIDISADDK